MNINELPENWREFSEKVEANDIPEDIAGKGDGVFDISCPEKGILMIIEGEKAYKLPEESFLAAMKG